MSRSLLLMALTLVCIAVQHALPVLFGVGTLPATPGAVIVAYGALTMAPLEAIITAALCGMVVDSLSGMPLGVSSFSMVVALLGARLSLRFFTGARGLTAAGFAGGYGALQTFLSGLLLAAFGERPGSLDLLDVAVIGVVDVGVALVLFPPIHAVARLLGLEERGTTLGERLATRT